MQVGRDNLYALSPRLGGLNLSHQVLFQGFSHPLPMNLWRSLWSAMIRGLIRVTLHSLAEWDALFVLYCVSFNFPLSKRSLRNIMWHWLCDGTFPKGRKKYPYCTILKLLITNILICCNFNFFLHVCFWFCFRGVFLLVWQASWRLTSAWAGVRV